MDLRQRNEQYVGRFFRAKEFNCVFYVEKLNEYGYVVALIVEDLHIYEDQWLGYLPETNMEISQKEFETEFNKAVNLLKAKWQ